jgi:hypothetical protein
VVLALDSAAVSAYWTVGGTALLDTVGGAIESLAEDRSAPALLLGVGVVLAKLVAVVLGLALFCAGPAGGCACWPPSPVRC